MGEIDLGTIDAFLTVASVVLGILGCTKAGDYLTKIRRTVRLAGLAQQQEWDLGNSRLKDRIKDVAENYSPEVRDEAAEAIAAEVAAQMPQTMKAVGKTKADLARVVKATVQGR